MRILAFVIFVIAFPVPSFATEWFASPAGSDGNGDGSFNAPFRTVGRALDAADSGDTVTLRGPASDNTYEECDLHVRVPLTLRSYAGELAHIDCDINVTDSVVLIIETEASGTTVSTLELSGSEYYGVKVNTDWYVGGGENETGASDILLENLKVHDTGHDGIKLTPKSTDVTIRGSEIWNTGAIYPPGTPQDDKNADGIDNVNGANMLVEDNYIHDIATTGLYFKGGAREAIVQRNRIERTEVGIRVGFDTSPEFFDLDENPHYYEAIGGIVRNNYIRDATYAGIGIYAALNPVVVNNTIVNTSLEGQAALYFGNTLQDGDPEAERPPTVNPVLRNNLVIQNGGDCVAVRWFEDEDLGPLSSLDGNPGTDWNGYYNAGGACRFVDQRPGSPIQDGGSLADWRSYEDADADSIETALAVDATGHLPSGSPAIDAGTPLAEVVDDIDRDARVGPYDIGADESAGAGAPDPVFASGFD